MFAFLRDNLTWLLLTLLAIQALAATEISSWTLAAPDGRCAISISLGSDGCLTYQTLRAGKKS